MLTEENFVLAMRVAIFLALVPLFQYATPTIVQTRRTFLSGKPDFIERMEISRENLRLAQSWQQCVLTLHENGQNCDPSSAQNVPR
jgi:hypothetical protein